MNFFFLKCFKADEFWTQHQVVVRDRLYHYTNACRVPIVDKSYSYRLPFHWKEHNYILQSFHLLQIVQFWCFFQYFPYEFNWGKIKNQKRICVLNFFSDIFCFISPLYEFAYDLEMFRPALMLNKTNQTLIQSWSPLATWFLLETAAHTALEFKELNMRFSTAPASLMPQSL